MKKAWLALPIVAVSLAFIGPAAPSGADSNILGTCPDGYTPLPASFANAEDRNGNGVVCVKFVDGHLNQHDDPNGEPYDCNGNMGTPECPIMAATDDILP
ncbi:MAG TPA: hypothetical protein VF712_01335 [Thermoleophilaceae bacterium]|jgi:hypothetical protein